MRKLYTKNKQSSIWHKIVRFSYLSKLTWQTSSPTNVKYAIYWKNRSLTLNKIRVNSLIKGIPIRKFEEHYFEIYLFCNLSSTTYLRLVRINKKIIFIKKRLKFKKCMEETNLHNKEESKEGSTSNLQVNKENI